jgi:hypothetical protein
VAVAAHALTTLATVLDELALEQDTGPKDTRLERYINAASEFVRTFCGRSFHREDNIAESVRGRGGTLIQVSRRPIITIDSITVDGATLQASTYSVDDADRGLIFRSTGWPWEAARMPGLSYQPIPGTEEPTIVVTYDGGFVTPAQAEAGMFSAAARTLPWDLEDAVVQLVVSRWKLRGRDVRVSSETYDSGGGFTFGGAPVPPEILAILDGYSEIPNA